FSPGGKIFPRGKNFWGPLFPQKGGKNPRGFFKNPRGFLKRGPLFGGFLKNPPKIFSPRGKNFFPRGKNFWGPPFSPQKRGEKPPGGFLKTPRGFLKKGGPLFWGFFKNPQKFFPPGEKIFSPGEKIFGGPLFSPKKGEKPPGVFKNPRGFLKRGPPFWGYLRAYHFSPGGKIFPRGKNFWGPLFPQKGGKNPRGFFK
ncbi:hypothetical protein EDM29_14355, partial [Staphylococcus aureus]